MEIQKAIEILSQWSKGTDPLYLPDLPEAVSLAIHVLQSELDVQKGDGI